MGHCFVRHAPHDGTEAAFRLDVGMSEKSPLADLPIDYRLNELEVELNKLRLTVAVQQKLIQGLLPALEETQRAAIDQRLDLIEMDAFEFLAVQPDHMSSFLSEWVACMRGALHGC